MNPYLDKPAHAFWRKAVSEVDPSDVDPVVNPRFQIGPDDRVATAGSCFAQHISRALQTQGFNYLITERGPVERNYGVYPARFGNIYTPRQMLQLIQRVYGLFEPIDRVWQVADGAADPFRPQIEPGGFADEAALEADRTHHFAAVRAMFETADVLVLTLGLTEGWVSTRDGAVFPTAPGVVGEAEDPTWYRPYNFSVQEIIDDLNLFITHVRWINPLLRIMLTVSPVSMIATFEDRHILTASTYSKSVLRVAAETVMRGNVGVDYFPGYEMVTGAHNRHRFLSANLRTLMPEGVAEVMGVFSRHYLGTEPFVRAPVPSSTPDRQREHEALSDLVCDEEANDQ